MHVSELDELRLPSSRRHPALSRAWREWCFVRVVFARFRMRLLLMAALVLAGGVCFWLFQPETQHSFAKAVFYTWALAFGEPPAEFPDSAVLRVLYFVVPVLGLIVVIEGIVEFALMLRDRKRNERTWCKIMAASLTNHVILVGLGKLGIRTFRLLQQLGEAVVVIERKPDNEFAEEVRRSGAPLFIGDARRETLLEEANVAKAKSVIIATNDDLGNLEIALDARKLNPSVNLVLRMFDQNMADKIREGFGIKIAMSQSAISAPTFVMSAVEPSIVNSHVINGRLIVMQRWYVRAGGPLCQKTVSEIMSAHGVGIVERRDASGTTHLMPPPDVQLQPNDELIVQGPYETLESLRELATPA